MAPAVAVEVAVVLSQLGVLINPDRGILSPVAVAVAVAVAVEVAVRVLMVVVAVTEAMAVSVVAICVEIAGEGTMMAGT